MAYRLTEVIAIYPITPSSPMAESCDEWSVARRPNLWSEVPRVVQMQSEGGVAGAVHGSLLAGSLTTTFTASQGLLLMIPNLYKIAGELMPFTLHVSARALAAQGLSIFGDHSDVMACRATGCVLLASNSVQEAQDLALVAHAASLDARLPFIHFFDGFRTSHEVGKIEPLSNAVLSAVIDEEAIADFRRRGLTPDRPSLRGTAQNPDVYFQGRETVNPNYNALPTLVQAAMDRVAAATGRVYHLFDYYGHPEADRVVVAMGSGIETLATTAEWLAEKAEKVGVVAVRLFHPFDNASFLAALPGTVKSIAVLDRTKEPGSQGEPLYLAVLAALAQGRSPLAGSSRIVGGRYGLGSKEFTPGMARSVFDHLKSNAPRDRFTVGIHDDVTGSSLPWDDSLELEGDEVRRCVFIGLGADGTVGANKNSIKIIGEQTDHYAQGYFVYDSKKSGSMTVSHLRFGPRPIRAPYLIREADFVACSQFSFVGKTDVLAFARPGATVLLESPHGAEGTWAKLPRSWRAALVAKNLKLFVIDANTVAGKVGMGRRTNTILQTCFFALSGVLPRDEAIAAIKKAIDYTYGKKGQSIVRMNHAAVDAALAELVEVIIPETIDVADANPAAAATPARRALPEFVESVTTRMLAGEGDALPVSAIPADGCWPTATSQYEKRGIALQIPAWDASICIQCNKCALVCPHAAIRAKFYDPVELAKAPEGFASVPFRSRELPGNNFTIQVAPEDCTGCSLCVQVCPAKDKTNPRHKALEMVDLAPRLDAERPRWDFFLNLPDPDRTVLTDDVKGSQFKRPLLEFSGACAGCGETPYLKLLTQLFGDRLVMANATGCSSIYGGNLPTTPYCTDSNGRGPAWANSLFEDNAEFGLGMRLALDRHNSAAKALVRELEPELGADFVRELTEADLTSEKGVADQRARVVELERRLAALDSHAARRLAPLVDHLVDKTVWIIGGDGWAYDIGYGGLDHVLASGLNVKVMVLDTEVYSNTGGQASKSTPLAAVAKFAAGGKGTGKKDLALMALQYGHVYVARVALGAKDSQTVLALREAEAWPGPALIIAYSPCIAHGYPLHLGLEQSKLAVDSGYWPLFRHDPRADAGGPPALKMDSPPPKVDVAKFMAGETRFAMLHRLDPGRADDLTERARARIGCDQTRLRSLGTPPAAPTPTPAASAPATSS